MAKILWADDEIDLLKPHVLFLEAKGHQVTTVCSGNEAIDETEEHNFDIVFLDENMPGLTGLDTLEKIKLKHPSIPIVMITKSEEESIMEEAIGGRISDYLIKPVNPNQILLSIKKILEGKRLVSEKTTSSYQQEFRQISMDLQGHLDEEEWKNLYRKIVYWDLKLAESNDNSMKEILAMQKKEANDLFSRFVEKNYLNWTNGIDTPLMSHELLKKEVFPSIGKKTTFMVLIDNLRYDQWQVFEAFAKRVFHNRKRRIVLRNIADSNTICPKFYICWANAFRYSKETSQILEKR